MSIAQLKTTEGKVLIGQVQYGWHIRGYELFTNGKGSITVDACGGEPLNILEILEDVFESNKSLKIYTQEIEITVESINLLSPVHSWFKFSGAIHFKGNGLTRLATLVKLKDETKNK